MSKKRTSPESSNNEQTDEGSDAVFQQADNAKRAKLTSLSDTTLQDLPMELIECILVKAVTMEVKDMKLAKSAWKEKADPVISRLRTVCPQWSNILTTDFFRNELQRSFNAQKTIRLEILHQSPLEILLSEAITLKDDLFMLCELEDEGYFAIHVYDRNDMEEVKDVIPLPGVEPKGIEACSVSNCLYILNNKAHHLSVIRITKTNEHQFNVSPLISGLRRRSDSLSVAANGNLVLLWQKRSEQRAVISVYGPNGYLQNEIWLSTDISQWLYKIIPKSNGNFVMVSCNDQLHTKLTEIDVNGTILRQYQSSLCAFYAVGHAHKYGRIVIAEGFDRIELLDSELNPLEFTGPQLDEDQSIYHCCRTHYNRERNEVATVVNLLDLLLFRFTEE